MINSSFLQEVSAVQAFFNCEYKINLPIINTVARSLYNLMLISCYPIVFAWNNTQTNLEYAPTDTPMHSYRVKCTHFYTKYIFVL